MESTLKYKTLVLVDSARIMGKHSHKGTCKYSIGDYQELMR